MFAMRKYGSLMLVLVMLFSVIGVASFAHADGEMLLLLPSGGGELNDSQQSPAGDSMQLIPFSPVPSQDEIAVYEIRFLNYEGGTMKTVYLEEGEAIVNPKITPTLSGYTFSHWCDVTAGTKAFVFGTAATRDVVLRPYFVRNQEAGDETEDGQDDAGIFILDGAGEHAPIGLLGLLLGDLAQPADSGNDAAQGTGENADQNQQLSPVADNPLLNAMAGTTDVGNAQPPANNAPGSDSALMQAYVQNTLAAKNEPAAEDETPSATPDGNAQSQGSGRHGNAPTAGQTRELLNTEGVVLSNGFVLVLSNGDNKQDPADADLNNETDGGAGEGDPADNPDGDPQEGDPVGDPDGDPQEGDPEDEENLLALVSGDNGEDEGETGEGAGDPTEENGEGDPDDEGAENGMLVLVLDGEGESDGNADGEDNQEEMSLIQFTPDDRSLTITTDISGEVSEGDLITLSAIFEEREGEVLEYTWQYFDGSAWIDYCVGGNAASFTLTQESYRWEWRVIVKIITPAPEA